MISCDFLTVGHLDTSHLLSLLLNLASQRELMLLLEAFDEIRCDSEILAGQVGAVAPTGDEHREFVVGPKQPESAPN